MLILFTLKQVWYKKFVLLLWNFAPFLKFWQKWIYDLMVILKATFVTHKLKILFSFCVWGKSKNKCCTLIFTINLIFSIKPYSPILIIRLYTDSPVKKKQFYKRCFVPKCFNNERENPTLEFFCITTVRAHREEIFSRVKVATGGRYRSPQNFSSGIYCCQMHYRVNHVTGYTSWTN